ncbi:MAG: 2Fe-2S iron-sulfur cluster-binding protein, partial [Anaerolineaceae bacterium]|nr:2Fe-2S iron-sulfur cluster-binding protein [Anaerolineaceae bacterium]
MRETIEVQLTVNGQAVSSKVPADLSLMRYLREWLGLTGTKDGCSSGHCGACTVIFNGKATRACLVRMSRAGGGSVTTIEGLSIDGRLHPLQHAFIQMGAVQCGFCTPGMIMSSKAFLDVNPKPSKDEIKAELTKNRNLCRCTGYVKIVEAIQAAGEMMAGGETSPPLTAEGSHVRSTILIRDAVNLVTGKTRFGADINLEGMLHGKILWAEHPHAEILGIDTSAAEAMPGVVQLI